MVKEAEANASEDAKRRQEVELRNETDALVYATQRSLTEEQAKLSSDERTGIERAIDDARVALNGDDLDSIRRAQEGLRRSAQTLAEARSRKATPANASASDGASRSTGDVVDAELVDEGKP